MRQTPAATLAVLAGALLGFGLASCSSPCQDLGSRICGCQPAGALQDACNTAVKNQIGGGSQQPNSADQTRCQALLDSCVAPRDPSNPSRQIDFCYFLQSPQGKCACGIAESSADGGCLDGGTDGGP